jgi:polyisoprenyl-teichoic acid--peptidoglycan teichoic acid transferase
MAHRRKARRTRLITTVFVLASLLACFALVATIRGIVTTARASYDHSFSASPRHRVSASSDVPASPRLPLSASSDLPPLRVLLLGSDQRGDDPGYRTDVIVLVSIDPATLTASAVSFPRDLWVEPPSLYGMKINMIQGIGGYDALAEMFETSFGVRPDGYVLVNFSGFTHLIDSLGGIDVQVGQSLTDSCDLPQEPDGVCAVEPGVVHMDGPTALWYARSRDTSSDFDRLRRAQEVVQAVFSRLMHLDVLAHLPETYAALTQDVETNLALDQITPLVPLAVTLFQDPQRIHRYVINEDQAYPSWSWDGMWILVPDLDAIRGVLREAGVNGEQ